MLEHSIALNAGTGTNLQTDTAASAYSGTLATGRGNVPPAGLGRRSVNGTSPSFAFAPGTGRPISGVSRFSYTSADAEGGGVAESEYVDVGEEDDIFADGSQTPRRALSQGAHRSSSVYSARRGGAGAGGGRRTGSVAMETQPLTLALSPVPETATPGGMSLLQQQQQQAGQGSEAIPLAVRIPPRPKPAYAEAKDERDSAHMPGSPFEYDYTPTSARGPRPVGFSDTVDLEGGGRRRLGTRRVWGSSSSQGRGEGESTVVLSKEDLADIPFEEMKRQGTKYTHLYVENATARGEDIHPYVSYILTLSFPFLPKY